MDAILHASRWLIEWFAGNGRYMKLTHCMGGDTFWISTTVLLDLLNAAGYSLIAVHWWRNSRSLPKVPAKSALADIRNIFVFCGICGYLFIPVKMVWPAWRLYDLVLAVLVFYTWRYALGARDMKVVYSALGQSTQLQRDLQASLEESRRKSLFLNAISHDLRTPLNGLALQATLAEMNLHDPEVLRDALVEIRSSAAQTASLLESLLDCARLDWSEQSNKISTFNLGELIADCIEVFKPSAQEKGLALQSNCALTIELNTDRIKLERILNNLIGNAIKFTQAGSVRIDVDDTQEGTEIHVIDTGVGIASQDQQKLFTEFYQVGNQARDSSKGFGLGLAISRRLALQLGGDLVVESAVDRGSRFSILIPRLNASVAAKPQVPESAKV